ncbi:MAG: DUF6152 family protein [Steroidobacteraceae bacterium]
MCKLRIARATLALSVGFALFSPWALAHHSYAMFDGKREVTIEGTVKEFQWTNPHAWLMVNVPVAGGETQEWAIEMGGPNFLIRQGWKKSMFKPGDKVSVVLNPMRNGSPGGNMVGATLASGESVKIVRAGGG